MVWAAREGDVAGLVRASGSIPKTAASASRVGGGARTVTSVGAGPRLVTSRGAVAFTVGSGRVGTGATLVFLENMSPPGMGANWANGFSGTACTGAAADGAAGTISASPSGPRFTRKV